MISEPNADLFCPYCGLPVATKAEVIALVQKRYSFTDEQLDSQGAKLRAYHLECGNVAENLATLPAEEARQMMAKHLANPDGFVYTLDIPTLRGYPPGS